MVTHADTAPTGRANVSGSPQARVVFGSSFLVLVASLTNFLHYHDYPLLRPETLIVAMGLLAVSGIIAIAHRQLGRCGKVAVEALIAYVAIDLNSENLVYPALAAVTVALLGLARGISLIRPLSIVAFVVLVTGILGLAERRPALATTGGPPRKAATTGPAILHLILDEHGGTGGSPDPEFRRMVADFYTRHGFRLFERAYSRHFRTVNAIPDILNFGRAGESRTVSKSLDVGRTSYLTALERNGYQLHFYQSNFADFCRYHRFLTCTSTWGPSLSFVEKEALPTDERARLVALKFAEVSSAAVTVADIIDDVTSSPAFRPLGIPKIAVKTAAVSDTLGGFALLQRIASDTKTAKPGHVYFAHVLAPHYPYVRTPDCKLVMPSNWVGRRSAEDINVRRNAYRGQVACLTRHLGTIVRNFQASPAGKDGIIVIHGDHGSRITALDPKEINRERLSPTDLMAGYSTLFAVLTPTIPPGIDSVPYSSTMLLKRLSETGFSSADGMSPGNNEVFLDGHRWRIGGKASIARAWPQ